MAQNVNHCFSLGLWGIQAIVLHQAGLGTCSGDLPFHLLGVRDVSLGAVPAPSRKEEDATVTPYFPEHGQALWLSPGALHRGLHGYRS